MQQEQMSVLLLHRWQAADGKRKAGGEDVNVRPADDAVRAGSGNVNSATREGGGQ
jgi:hypothetical protein